MTLVKRVASPRNIIFYRTAVTTFQNRCVFGIALLCDGRELDQKNSDFELDVVHLRVRPGILLSGEFRVCAKLSSGFQGRAATDFAARITNPATGTPDSMRNSAWTISGRSLTAASNRST